MGRTGKKKGTEVANPLKEVLAKYKDLVRAIPEKTELYRTQPSKYDANPINYKIDSDTRYADPDQQTGVFYLGFSERVAMQNHFSQAKGVTIRRCPRHCWIQAPSIAMKRFAP